MDPMVKPWDDEGEKVQNQKGPSNGEPFEIVFFQSGSVEQLVDIRLCAAQKGIDIVLRNTFA